MKAYKDLKEKFSHSKTGSLPVSPPVLQTFQTIPTNNPSARTAIPTMDSRIQTKESAFKKNADKKRITTLESNSSESSHPEILDQAPEKPTLNNNNMERAITSILMDKTSPLIIVPDERNEPKISYELKIKNMDFNIPKNVTMTNPTSRGQDPLPTALRLDLTDESSNLSLLDERKEKNDNTERSPRNSLVRRFSNLNPGIQTIFEKRPRSSTNYPPGIDKPKIDSLASNLSPPKTLISKNHTEKGGKPLYEKSMKSTNSLYAAFSSNKKTSVKGKNKIVEKGHEKALTKDEIDESIFQKIKEIDEEKEEEKKSKETPRRASKDLAQILEKNDTRMFSPQLRGVSPKLFHLFSTKIVDGEKRAGKIFPENQKSAEKFINDKQGTRPNNKSIRSTQRYKFPSRLHQVSRSIQLEKKPPKETSISMNVKVESFKYYLELMRKLELVKFTVSFAGMQQPKAPNSKFLVEIDNVRIKDKDDSLVYHTLVSKYGKDYYIILRKMFNMYSTEKNGNKVLTFRQLACFLKDFGFFENFKKLDLITVQLIFKKRVPKTLCDFKGFIEILFKLSKILETSPKAENDVNFKAMIDRHLLPKYKELSIRVYEFNINKIQIFYQQYDDYENPVVMMLYQNDDLLKHIFAMYESKDIKKSTDCFISLKSFIKFCNDFNIIPFLCNTNQVVKLFRSYQKNDEEIIGFSSYVLLICCIAHIGLSSPDNLDKYKGFYQKLWKLFESLMKTNSQISDNLVLERLLNNK